LATYGTPAQLKVAESGQAHTSIVVRPGESVLIGRDRTAQVRIADTRSSRRHLMVEREASGWLVRDLGTTNGSRVLEAGGQARDLRGDAVRITSGQVVIGNAVVTLYAGDQQPAVAAQTYAAPAPAYSPPAPAPMPQFAPSQTGSPAPVQYSPQGSMPPEQRRALLGQQIASMVASQGARVESQSDFQAVLATGQPVNHVLHAIIFFCTCGIWLLVWLILALTGGVRRQLVTVDEFGNVNVQAVRR
jgi:hypothetical protein